MKLEEVNIQDMNLISSETSDEGMRIRQSGIAKVLWQKLDAEVPESRIIPNGVDLYKG